MIVKKVIYMVLVIVVIFLVFVAYEIITYKQPIFFPLDNSQGKYKITKKCPNSQGWIEDVTTQSRAYCVEYKGSNVFNDNDGNSSFFRITVGKSDVDLEQYLDKQVKNIKGDFVSSKKQCILNKCVDIGTRVVLNVDSLELAN